MAQPSNKKSSQASPKFTAGTHGSAKTASTPANKAANAALSAMETTRNSVESVAKISTDTLKDLFLSSSEETQKAQEKFFAIGREGVENVSRAVDALTRTMSDLVGVARENADAAVEVNHIAADIAKSINSELMDSANSNFTDNVDICKEAFSCRDINDVLELQNKWLATNVENFFAQSTRLAEMLFQLATEAAEPINERVAEATERLSKTLAA